MNLAGCRSLSPTPETGTWYRAIQPQHWPTALKTNQTRTIPSRFNAGASAPTTFEVLYLSEIPIVALYEVEALYGTLASSLPNPRQAWVVLNVKTRLQHVADLTEPGEQRALGTTAQELTGDWRQYVWGTRSGVTASTPQIAPTQELGAVLFGSPEFEGFFAISAKVPSYRTLVVFPHKLKKGSRIEFNDPATGNKHVIP